MHSLRRTVSLVSLFVVLAVAGASTTASAQYPDPDRWILQASARLINGFGFARGMPHQGLMGDTGIRADFLFGKPGDEHFRIGPAIDFRSACTMPIFVSCIHNETIEGGAGGTVLIPFRRGYPLTITSVGGYAFRRDSFGGDGLYWSNTLAWGYRPYNYFHRYGYGIEAFVSHRVHVDLNDITNFSTWEMTFGIEFDLELAVWVPILIVRMALQNDDPDEPEDPIVRDVGGSTTGADEPSRQNAPPAASPSPSATEPEPTETGAPTTGPEPEPAPTP